MTHKLTQSSTATANTTAPDSETPDVSMDFDVIRSINNIRDRKASDTDSKLTSSIMDRYDHKRDADDEHAKKETHILTATFTVAGKPVKYTHIFHINHGEDNATVISTSYISRDKRLDYSVHAAREVYRTLLRRGFKAE